MNDISVRVHRIMLNVVDNAPYPTNNYFTLFLTKEEAEYIKTRFISKIDDDYYEYVDKNLYKIYIIDNENN